jgi:phosphatidylinositol kinase/protein kinase (PI-3  family)
MYTSGGETKNVYRAWRFVPFTHPAVDLHPTPIFPRPLPIHPQMAPDYDHLTVPQKVEVFDNALESTTGQDLYKVHSRPHWVKL